MRIQNIHAYSEVCGHVLSSYNTIQICYAYLSQNGGRCLSSIYSNVTIETNDCLAMCLANQTALLPSTPPRIV